MICKKNICVESNKFCADRAQNIDMGQKFRDISSKSTKQTRQKRLIAEVFHPDQQNFVYFGIGDFVFEYLALTFASDDVEVAQQAQLV